MNPWLGLPAASVACLQEGHRSWDVWALQPRVIRNGPGLGRLTPKTLACDVC